MENNQAISGIFIPFTDKELKKLYAALEDWGCPTDGQGVKKILMEVIDDDENDQRKQETGTGIVDLLIQNPQIINAGISAFHKVIKAMKKAPATPGL